MTGVVTRDRIGATSAGFGGVVASLELSDELSLLVRVVVAALVGVV